MGTYINRGNNAFRDIISHEYVDKSSLIPRINAVLNSESRYSCVSRCRRFGKSMAAKMLCAYYDKSCDSRKLFAGLECEKDPSFETYLNKYRVIYLDVTSFTARPEIRKDIVRTIQGEIMYELKETFPDVRYKPTSDLMDVLSAIHQSTGEKFFFIIDEWDAICREFPQRQKMKSDPDNIIPTILDEYAMLLRRLFKTQDSDEVFAGAYLTGILPIKKYNTESAMNNFCEYSMIRPGKMASVLGFTHEEVEMLCNKHGMDIRMMEQWYDGYRIGKASRMFNPYSVIKAINEGEYGSYWTTTGAYDSVITYVQMNFDGLKDDIIRMLAGERAYVNTTGFTNDMQVVRSKDDVLTVLIHLGYLAYDKDTQECYIPNKEVADEMNNAVNATSWNLLAESINNSRALLNATIQGNERSVVKGCDHSLL